MTLRLILLTLLGSVIMSANAQSETPSDPVEVIQAVLANPTDLESVSNLVAEDVTYVSLNYDNPELKSVLPWTGTRQGPQAIVDTFAGVNLFWETEDFEITEIFGSGESVAVFGSFTYRSRNLDKTTTSPFSILAKVVDSRVTYMQFMEDTFETTSSFRTGGTWNFSVPADPEAFGTSDFESTPEGSDVNVGNER